MKFGTPVKQSQPMPDLWFYGILNFLNKVRGSSNFGKIRAIILKLYTNIFYRSRNFGIDFAKIDWSVQNFSDFEFFENFLKII